MAMQLIFRKTFDVVTVIWSS